MLDRKRREQWLQVGTGATRGEGEKAGMVEASTHTSGFVVALDKVVLVAEFVVSAFIDFESLILRCWLLYSEIPLPFTL